MKSFFGLRIELVYDGIFVKKTKFLYKRLGPYNSTNFHPSMDVHCHTYTHLAQEI